MDVQAARLTAQKLTENGIKGEVDRVESSSKEDEVETNAEEAEDGEEGNEDEDEVKKKETTQNKPETPNFDQTSLSDLEELLFCRSGNQIKVCT